MDVEGQIDEERAEEAEEEALVVSIGCTFTKARPPAGFCVTDAALVPSVYRRRIEYGFGSAGGGSGGGSGTGPLMAPTMVG